MLVQADDIEFVAQHQCNFFSFFGIKGSASGDKSSYENELHNAQIFRDVGNTVYLTPERRAAPGKKYDAIVSGLMFEFKNVGGNANTLITHFIRSRSLAPNVFINLERSDLTKHEVMSALYGARNRKTHTNKRGTTISGYDDINRFDGGSVVLKLKGHGNLVYMDVDNLKIHLPEDPS